MIAASVIVDQARTLLSRPWAHQGRGEAVDCAGVVVLTARAAGIQVLDVRGYAITPDGVTLRKTLIESGCVPCDPAPGCVALMNWGRAPSHLGIITNYVHGGLGLLHGYSVVGQVTEHRLDDKWSRRIVSCWALPGVEYGS